MLVVSPLFVILPRKNVKDKKFILNLNTYRNTNYFILNDAKRIYEQYMLPQLEILPVMEKVSVTYVLYPKTKRRCDIPNICSIHEKFFMDTLVISGKIADDDYLHHTESHIKFGCVDKENPRVDIYITSI